MWKCGMILLLCFGVDEITSANMPAYIKPCSRTKDFSSCATKRGNEAIPFLLKGDPELKVPNLLPLKLSEVDVTSGSNLKMKLSDIELNGFDTATLTNLEVDFSKQTIQFYLDVARLQLIATYNVEGQIMVLPVQGHGPANITIVNSHFKYLFSYKLEKRKGKEYAIIQDHDKLSYEIEKAYFKLDNLFNGNQVMGDNLNKFLNENDQDVLKELGGVIQGTIRAVAKQVGEGVLGNIPFNDLFLD